MLKACETAQWPKRTALLHGLRPKQSYIDQLERPRDYGIIPHLPEHSEPPNAAEDQEFWLLYPYLEYIRTTRTLLLHRAAFQFAKEVSSEKMMLSCTYFTTLSLKIRL